MKRVKLGNESYLDSAFIVHGRKKLSKILDKLKYEEGTWMPVISTVENIEPTADCTFRYGNYRKIGNLVYVDFCFRGRIHALNGVDNYAIVKGLPFPIKSQSNYFGQMNLSVGIVFGMLETEENIRFLLNESGIRIQCNGGSTATKLIVTPSNYPYFEIGGSGWYLTDD